MQCFICGEQMRVVMVEPHIIELPGFELRTFQCVGCGDTEKRPVFDSTRSLQAPVLVPETIAAPSPSPSQTPPASAKVKSILGSLVRLRGGTPH
jgi:hypothetical protein